MDEVHRIEGYIRCKHCGKPVPEPYARQTASRCTECFQKDSPLVPLEIILRGQRLTIRSNRKEKVEGPWRRGTAHRRAGHRARDAAQRRLQQLFPDLYAVLYDEERVKRGLHPIARYNPVEFESAVSETLDFHEVYDAVRSSGVTDGP